MVGSDMMMDTGTIYDAGMVTWQRGHGSVEASDLGLTSGNFPLVVFMRSPRTGTVLGFVQAHAFTMAGEFGGFTYTSTTGISVDVHND